MNGTYRMRSSDTARFKAITESLAHDGLEYTIEVDDDYTMVFASGTYKHKPARTTRVTRVKVPGVAVLPAAPLTVEQCEKELAATFARRDSFLRELKSTLHYQWTYTYCDGTHYDASRIEAWRYRNSKRVVAFMVGRALSKIIKIRGSRDPFKMSKEDYAIIDEAYGSKVKRESQMPSHESNYLAYVAKHYAGAEYGAWDHKQRHKAADITPSTPLPASTPTGFFVEWDKIKADVEYWTELVELARMREKKKGESLDD